MTLSVRSHVGDADHRHNGDDGNLWFGPFGSVVAPSSTHFLPAQKHAPTQNIATCDGHRDKHLPDRDRIAHQAAPTIPIAH